MAGLALGLLFGFSTGSITGYAYDSASLKTATVENRTSIVVTGTASRDTNFENEVAEKTASKAAAEEAAKAADEAAVKAEAEAAKKPGDAALAEAAKAAREAAKAAETAAKEIIIPVPDDGYYYLFELQPYEEGIGSRTDYVAWSDKVEELSFILPFTGTPEDSRLYSRFVLALKTGDSYRPISNNIYVTNPGDVAEFREEFPDAMSKKGLLIELDMLGDAMNLGVKHTTINIPYHQLIGGDLPYEYNGKTYYFNRELLAVYDRSISAYSNKSIVVTGILLNGWNDAHPELIRPGVPKTAGSLYYGFNTATPEGYETTRALLSFMAERYSGEHYEYGRVSNWIVGNEVNNNQNWNYVGPMDLKTYTKVFEEGFRVAYTAIKSHSRNARVYFSTDYNWKTSNTDLKYAAKDLIDLFNEGIRSEGNIEWGLAYHPYPHPLTEPEFWDDHETGMVNQTVDSPVVNFANLNVLTDYFQRPELLNSDGTVRHIILSEEGFTSESATRGPVYNIQAAAYAYAYYLVDANPYIDAFILNRQMDAVIEVEASCAFGLWTIDMDRPDKAEAMMPKNIYNVFKYIDTKKSLQYTEFAKPIIGIEKWSDVIPNFRLEE